MAVPVVVRDQVVAVVELLFDRERPRDAGAMALLQAGVDRNRQAVIDRYLTTMSSLSGRPAAGAAVFTAACASCHRFGAVAGAAIGPDLGAVKDRSAGYLTTHILDPNRAVEERYKLFTATLQDGRTLAGLLEAEAGNSLTLRGLDGAEQPVLRSVLSGPKLGGCL